MTIADIINKLKELPQDLEVEIGDDVGRTALLNVDSLVFHKDKYNEGAVILYIDTAREREHDRA